MRIGVAHTDQRRHHRVARRQLPQPRHHLGLRHGTGQLERLVPPDRGGHDLVDQIVQRRQAENGQHLVLVAGGRPDVAADEVAVGLQVVEGSGMGVRRGGHRVPLERARGGGPGGDGQVRTAVAVPPAVTEPESFTGASARARGRFSPSVSLTSTRTWGSGCFPAVPTPAVRGPERFRGRLLLRRPSIRGSAGLSHKR